MGKNCIRARIAMLLFPLISALCLAGCQAQAGNSSTQEYRKFLAISKVKSSYYTEPKTKQKYALVEGYLSNLGPQTLIVVEFTFRFKDKLRNVIYEERAYPVFVSEFSQTAGNEALKPGGKTRFAFKSPNCPPSWQPGEVDIEITKIVPAKPS